MTQDSDVFREPGEEGGIASREPSHAATAHRAEGGAHTPKERPILFSAPMVRALLAGTKTQTRRVVKRRGRCSLFDVEPDGSPMWTDSYIMDPGNAEWRMRDCPYGVPGDVLWVREAHALHELFSDVARVVYAASVGQSWTEAHEDFPAHLADGMVFKPFQTGFRPSIHMPRWASRITLKITDVRVERVQDISEADALAEGVCEVGPRAGDGMRSFGVEGMPERRSPICCHPTAARAYRFLWDHINGAGSWDANPWVWCVSFQATPPQPRDQPTPHPFREDKPDV